jgi:sugar phosphate isomerase/epimerase
MTETKQIRIGNQTAFTVAPIVQPFNYAVIQGFDAFEWFPDKKKSGEGWTEDDIQITTRMFIRETARTEGISLSVHASFQSNPLKQAADELFKNSVKFARDIGATLFNIHFYPADGIKAYVASIEPLLEILAQANMKLSIENTPETTPQDFNRLFKYLGHLGSPYVFSIGMCLDIGHANLCGPTRNDYLRYIDLLDPGVPIIHVHLHENYGDYDSHLPVFTGPAGKDPSGIKGLIERLKKRGFSGSIILEQWPQPAELLDEARNKLLALFGNVSGE